MSEAVLSATTKMAIAFGGGGARAFSITAGILSVLNPSFDVMLSANSAASWAVVRWIKGANMWTPADLDEHHPQTHILHAASRPRMVATFFNHAFSGRRMWKSVVSELLATPTKRRPQSPELIITATLCTQPMQLLEMTENETWDFNTMCAFSSFAPGFLLTLNSVTERVVPKHGPHYVVDGGYVDNLALVPLVRRKIKHIISIINTPIQFSMDESTWRANDLCCLFGADSVVFGHPKQLFDAELLHPTMQAIHDGNGIATCAYVVDGVHIDITWVYIMHSQEFVHSLPRSVARRISAIKDFPHIQTFAATAELVTIKPFTANALFLYGRHLGERLLKHVQTLRHAECLHQSIP